MRTALDNLLRVAALARLRLQTLSSEPESLVHELGDAIAAVEAELNKTPQELHDEALQRHREEER